ncbi:hypothetical protein JCM15093_3050 [Bacteroides graminisolvens DSM 19988 = JCM 15093]|uniref:Response regulatory domain-containing protein n=1 Tax=Bacteroides graminisolvens DSM 19988 = JCM 15093 TaxID=1121097 RepID=A0A069D601_9BACE|nr:hypothetical protein [Bacteroides graminisolvens]GAK37775.1 hypothetical protein JCM15093_3050 [Bacteroides graminisolvens DSM 19988 = JCM 15093]
MKKILLVEDLPQKADNIKSLLKLEFPEIEIEERSSYHTAIEEIYRNYNKYFVVLLDVSMSTYDAGVEENGGIPEALAGKMILDGMYLRDIPVKVKVMTMYESFDGKSIQELDKELREDSPENYDGYIFFLVSKK